MLGNPKDVFSGGWLNEWSRFRLKLESLLGVNNRRPKLCSREAIQLRNEGLR